MAEATIIADLRKKKLDSEGGKEMLIKMLNSLLNPTHEKVAGTTSAMDIAVANIKTTDEIISVLHFSTTVDYTDVTDRTGEASISSDGNIQLSTTDTSSDDLLVCWVDMTF